MYKPGLVAGTLFGMLSVILGAFGAHSLKQILSPDQLGIFTTAVTYQFYHSFALLIAGILYRFFPYKVLRLASAFFITGIIFFSGSLYLMNVLSTSGRSIGMVGIVTPIGGLFFILGWLFLLLGILKKEAA
jgi:uncharacterized membrane protein YgdD (TMEM256/DUF423 family)